MGWTQRHVKNPKNGMPLSKQKNLTTGNESAQTKGQPEWFIYMYAPLNFIKSSGDQSVKLNKVEHAVNTDSGQILTRNGTLSL